MGELIFSTDHFVPNRTPMQVFDLIGHPSVGWILGLSCDRVEVGAAVRFDIPGMDGGSLAATGRFRTVDPGRKVVIDQETPWKGRISVRLESEGTATRLRMLVSLADDCLQWFLGSTSASLEDREPAVTIGMMVSLSGTAGILGRAALNAAELAVAEINADGGIRGLPLRLAIADDRSSPVEAAAQCSRLIADERASAIIAMVSSASFRSAAVVARRSQSLLIHAPVTEGGCDGRTILQFGARPSDQLAHAVPTVMRHYDTNGWYLVGSDYCWPRAVGEVARQVIDTAGGRLLGQRYLGLGSADFRSTIDAIERTGADLILSALVGHDAVAFERALYEAGLRQRVRTLATLIDDSVLEHIGAAASEGIWSTLDHVDADSDVEPIARAWRQQFGAVAPPLSSTAMSVYEALHLYAQAAQAAASGDGPTVANELRSGRLGNSRPLARLAGQRRPTSVAEAVDGRFQIRIPAV
jgi:urea transport system substrate-binding protein